MQYQPVACYQPPGMKHLAGESYRDQISGKTGSLLGAETLSQYGRTGGQLHTGQPPVILLFHLICLYVSILLQEVTTTISQELLQVRYTSALFHAKDN